MSLWLSSDEYFHKTILIGDDGASVDLCFTFNVLKNIRSFEQLKFNVTHDFFSHVHQEGQLIETAFGSRGSAIHTTIAGKRIDIYGLVYDLNLQFLDIKA